MNSIATLPVGRRQALLAALSCLAGAIAPPAGAAARYPDHAIRLIVGFTPGGGADFAARLVAQRLGEALGGTVVTDNKAGANGTIAAGEVARATADGYSLLLGVTASQSISPAIMAKPPYDPLRDFTPITMVGYTPLVLVVNPKLPVTSVRQFIDYVKASPEPVPYGSAGVGNITHLAAELFVQTTGARQLRHIPYKGSSQVITDLLGGQVQAYFDTLPSSLPFIQSGQLRALAVTSEQRASAAPEIPTMIESGVKDYSPTTWFGVFGPAGMDPALVRKIQTALQEGFAGEQARTAMTSRGVEPVFDSPDQFRKTLESDLQQWRDVIAHSKITLE